MDALAREHLVDFYSKQLMIMGDRPEALRWSPGGQIKRYAAMLGVMDDPAALNGARVLDLGCGKGDLYAFLKARGLSPIYTGIDITPGFIKLASSKYQKAEFRVQDIEETPLGPDERFDYAFICGVFNNRVEGATESLMNVMRSVFRHVDTAMAVTALSSTEPSKSFELNYVDPAELLSFTLRELSPHAALRHDIIPHESVIYIRRAPVGA